MWIRGLDAGIVPCFYFTEKNIDVDIPLQSKIPADPIGVVGENKDAGRCGYQLDTTPDFRHLFVAHRGIAGTKIDGPRDKPLDPLATAYSIVTQHRLGVSFFILFHPFLIERGWEGRPGPGELNSISRDIAPGTLLCARNRSAADR